MSEPTDAMVEAAHKAWWRSAPGEAPLVDVIRAVLSAARAVDPLPAELLRLREALAVAENRSENYRRLWEDGEDWPKGWAPCNARSDYKECVFHCTEPAGHEGAHIGGTHGMLWTGESDRPNGVIANPPRSATPSPDVPRAEGPS